MKEKELKDVPKSSVNALTRMLSDGYSELVGKGLPLKTFPAVMLWGAPGIGKSQAVRQLAESLESRTGKRVVITDVRLLLFNPIDLRGIPTANADKTLAVWLKPSIFKMDESKNVVNILFLDELTAAPQSVQAAAYQIALDRIIGEHKLPENCIVIAAGNRLTDKSVAFKMPKALCNRLMHIEVECSYESWREWAVRSGVENRILGFLSFRRSFLMTDDPNEDVAYPTPRSWEMASNVLRFVQPDLKAAMPMIAGLVGNGAASELKNWCSVYRDLPSIADIFDGKPAAVPQNTDALYALAASITAYAREHKDDTARITNAIRYAQRLPADFSVLLLKDFSYLEPDYRSKLMKIPEFTKWLKDKGRLLNGNI